MTSVGTLVHNVLARLGGEQLSRLNICDHGSDEGIEIGSDWITSSSLGPFASTLAQLAGRFSRNGFVHLQHCHAGRNRQLLIDLARIVGLPVYAGTGIEQGIFRMNLGSYVHCTPNAHCERKFRRP